MIREYHYDMGSTHKQLNIQISNRWKTIIIDDFVIDLDDIINKIIARNLDDIFNHDCSRQIGWFVMTLSEALDGKPDDNFAMKMVLTQLQDLFKYFRWEKLIPERIYHNVSRAIGEFEYNRFMNKK